MNQKSTQKTSLDPKFSSAVYGNLANAQDLQSAYKPYTGDLVAGFTGAQKEAQQGILDFSSQKVGSGLLGQASDAAGQSAAYRPMDVNAGQLAGTDLSPYMNPYQSQVIDNTLSQYGRQNQIDMNNARGRAAQAGAFGGSGAALLQAQMGEANGRTLASTLAGLNNQNFNQAQGAAQSDIATRLAAAQGNQQAGLAGNAQRLQASGILSGLSDQQRAQGLQDWQLEAMVGDQQQAQQQGILSSEYQRYIDEMNQRLALQGGANGAVGLIPQTGSTTQKTSGLGTVVSGIGSAVKTAGQIAAMV